ncbi:hypothetical protein BU17DRAFT_93052 [Hysterangium stoloniferum]|nr:hypothetical protein BU17DRAFT_93052 [Hysterangium stoloniferum]
MASVVDLQRAAIQEATAEEVWAYTDFTALVLFSYDTILTLPAEIQFVWKSRIRLASVLYIIARYSVLLECIFNVVFDWADGPLESVVPSEPSQWLFTG